MNPCHIDINWTNNQVPAINDTNLGQINTELREIDTRVCSLANDPAGEALVSEGWAEGTQAGVPVTSGSPYYQNNSDYHRLESEGWANGEQDGVPVSSGSPYYENNAKYWKEQAQAIVGGSLAGLSDVDINNPQDGDNLVYDGANSKWINGKKWKTFAIATDAEIAEMVTLADAGLLDLYEDCGWRVGQEHQVSLSAIAASGTYDGVSWSVGESSGSQTITLVLSNRGGYELVNSVLDKQGQTRTECSFQVDCKDNLSTLGYINSTNTTSGSWDGCARRNWCNGGFREALPSELRGVFKQFKTITAQTYNGSTNQTSSDYFALRAAKEIFGSATGSNATEAAALSQVDWYKTSSHIVHTVGWFTRSPYASNSSAFTAVNNAGSGTAYLASEAHGLSPFGCL